RRASWLPGFPGGSRSGSSRAPRGASASRPVAVPGPPVPLQAAIVSASARVAAPERRVLVGRRVPLLQERVGLALEPIAVRRRQGGLEPFAVDRLIALEVEAIGP